MDMKQNTEDATRLQLTIISVFLWRTYYPPGTPYSLKETKGALYYEHFSDNSELRYVCVMYYYLI